MEAVLERSISAERPLTLTRFSTLLAAAITIPFSAILAFYPGRLDNAIFLYIGEMWSKGVVPYVQIFDNKPPGIFAVTALASFTQHTLWALFLLEFAFVMGCVVAIRAILQRCGAPDKTVFFGTITTALIINSAVYVPGSNPETYMLLPMTASMLAFIAALETKKSNLFFVAGLCSGIACIFKPFGLSAMMAQIIFILLYDRKKASSIVFLGVGAVAAWIPVFGYFALHHGVREMLDASFFYNVGYGAASQQKPLDVVALLCNRLLPVAPVVGCLVFWLPKLQTQPSHLPK